MELLLGINGEFGLYDRMAQKQWYEYFTVMQKEISSTKDPEKLTQYGILSLPVLAAEYRNGNNKAIYSLQDIVNKYEVKSEKNNMLNNKAALDIANLDTWLMKNNKKVTIINELLNSSYEWVQ